MRPGARCAGQAAVRISDLVCAPGRAGPRARGNGAPERRPLHRRAGPRARHRRSSPRKPALRQRPPQANSGAAKAALAQLVEHIIRNDGVRCSSHLCGTRSHWNYYRKLTGKTAGLNRLSLRYQPDHSISLNATQGPPSSHAPNASSRRSTL